LSQPQRGHPGAVGGFGVETEENRAQNGVDLHGRVIIDDCVIVCLAKPLASRNLPDREAF